MDGRGRTAKCLPRDIDLDENHMKTDAE
jgi:hypothetical protein